MVWLTATYSRTVRSPWCLISFTLTMVSVSLNLLVPVVLSVLVYYWHHEKTKRGAYGIIQGRKRNWPVHGLHGL